MASYYLHVMLLITSTNWFKNLKSLVAYSDHTNNKKSLLRNTYSSFLNYINTLRCQTTANGTQRCKALWTITIWKYTQAASEQTHPARQWISYSITSKLRIQQRILHCHDIITMHMESTNYSANISCHNEEWETTVQECSVSKQIYTPSPEREGLSSE